MFAHTASSIVDRLHNAGLKLFVSPNRGLAVTPASQLTSEQRDLIRSSKPLLIDWLMAANDADNLLPDPPVSPAHWKELSAAYHDHHFKCQTCIAAGRGARYGQRCGVGTTLWSRYMEQAERITEFRVNAKRGQKDN